MTPPAEPLTLPAPPDEPRRAGFPLIAMLAPVLGGLGLWVVTGSMFALWFAALGPVIAVAALLDGIRTRRRERRDGERRYAAALAALRGEVVRAQQQERATLIRQHPDAAALWERPGDLWRPAGERASALVVGWGSRPSAVSIGGYARGRGDAEQVRRDAAVVADVPVTVRWLDGVAVHGNPTAAVAVLRALLVQLFLTHPPDRLRLVGPLPAEWTWLESMPHRGDLGGGAGAASGVRAARGVGETVRVGVRGPGMMSDADADVVFAWNAAGAVPHPRCRHLLEVREVPAGSLVTDEETRAVQVEAISQTQAHAVARALSRRATDVFGPVASDADTMLALSTIEPSARAGDRSTLCATIGRGPGGDVEVDLVADGPHALVAGVTGTGKSELLVTWVTALCGAHTTQQLSLLLADFKGGLSFEPLMALPHVTGVITDLDAASASRAIASLRAEMRRREAELVRCGARQIGDSGVELPRLVVVVDEFAALAGEHAELQRVFTDIAARGRALGMHLILGTQRTSGTVHDALAANIPLRLALRVADAGESRMLIGSDVAATLPGGVAGRGRAYVRRASDAAPAPFRVALARPADVAHIAARARDQRRPEPAWLPELPAHIALDPLRAQVSDPAAVVLGLADEPELQRRAVVALHREDRGLLVLGGPGSGRSGLLATVAAQRPDAVLVPRDAERAWDMIHALRERPADWLLIDDVDVLLSSYPGEQAAHLAGVIDEIVRDAAGRSGVVMTAQHVQGTLSRIAERFPRRAMLGYPSRAAHVAAGGEVRDHRAQRIAGRAHLDGREVQFALASPAAEVGEVRSLPSPAPDWSPSPGNAVGVIARDPHGVARALRESFAGQVEVAELSDAPSVAGGELRGGAARVLVGDGDAWQASWSSLSRVRARGALVVDAACPSELRVLAGHRAVAPYAHPGIGRAWWCEPGRAPRRVQLVPGES